MITFTPIFSSSNLSFPAFGVGAFNEVVDHSRDHSNIPISVLPVTVRYIFEPIREMS
jgi:hypothetical protein